MKTMWMAVMAIWLTGAMAHAAPASQPADAEKALERVMSEVKFERMLLSEAMEFLQEITGCNIAVRWPDLEAVGIGQEAAVTLRVRNVTLKTVLRTLIESLGQAKTIGFWAKDNVLVIGSREQSADESALVATYNVADLGDTDEETAQLSTLITSTVDQESWVDNGGRLGTMQRFKDVLIIKQSAENHDRIKLLLEKVREAVSKSPPSARLQANLSEAKARIVENMKSACFNPEAMGLVAIGGLQNEVRVPPAELASFLEAQLMQTLSLGLRNAIRLTLKDIYIDLGKPAEARKHLEAMFRENDQAQQRKGR